MSERLHEAAERLAEVALQMYDAEALGGLACREVEAIADVLRAIDANEAADCIIQAHGAGDDDPLDAHHDLYLANEEADAHEILTWRAEYRRYNADDMEWLRTCIVAAGIAPDAVDMPAVMAEAFEVVTDMADGETGFCQRDDVDLDEVIARHTR